VSLTLLKSRLSNCTPLAPTTEKNPFIQATKKALKDRVTQVKKALLQKLNEGDEVFTSVGMLRNS
jgi:hypothetical protein